MFRTTTDRTPLGGCTKESTFVACGSDKRIRNSRVTIFVFVFYVCIYKMGWGSFWHGVAHPIESLKHAGQSVLHAAESAAHSVVQFAKHTEEKVLHAIVNSAPVQFVKHTEEKVVHAFSSVAHKVGQGLSSAVDFVKHTATTIGDGVAEVWHGAESFGSSLLSMTKIIPYAIAGGVGLFALSMTKREGNFDNPSSKRSKMF